jgi:hypothetical protein
VKYELGFYIPDDSILHSQFHDNLEPYMLMVVLQCALLSALCARSGYVLARPFATRVQQAAMQNRLCSAVNSYRALNSLQTRPYFCGPLCSSDDACES